MTPYPRDVEQAMRAFAASLREHDRRRYAAVEAAKFGRGGVAYIARVLGLDPKTVRRGRADLEAPPPLPPGRVRAPGGGRKRRVDAEPDLDDDFRAALADHTAGSPDDPQLRWTGLTARQVADRLDRPGRPVGPHLAAQLLRRHGYRRRKALRSRRLGDHPDRAAQFEAIAGLKARYRAAGDPVLSVDTKAREPLGDFYREGRLYAREPPRAFDHDYYDFGPGVAVPHGLYDTGLNRGYVHLALDHDTSELACDSLLDWWGRFGRAQYPAARSLLLLCDGGGSNPADTERCQAHGFRAELQRVADATGLEVRVAHYPPYASKYNPIEHRLFPHLGRACRGVFLSSLEHLAGLMRGATTRAGLEVAAEVMTKAYRTGRTVAEEVKHAIVLVRDEVLPRWNYRILPHA